MAPLTPSSSKKIDVGGGIVGSALPTIITTKTTTSTSSASRVEAPVTGTTTGSPITTTILISNLHCSSCSLTISKVLSALSPPPLSISSNILTHEVTVIHPAELLREDILRGLLEAEFKIDSFTSAGNSSELITWSGGGNNGRVISFEDKNKPNCGGGGRGGGPWLDSAGERLKVAFELGRKRKRHLDTCELCKNGEQRKRVSTSSTSTLLGQPSSSINGSDRSEGGVSEFQRSGCSTALYNLTIAGTSSPDFSSGFSINRNIPGSPMQLPVVNKSQMAAIDEKEEHLSSGKLTDTTAACKEVGYDGEPLVVTTTIPSTVLYEALLSVDGMTCSACTGSVTETIQALSFVRRVEVNLMSNSATVQFEGQEGDAAKVVDEVESAGFECALQSIKEVGGAIDQNEQVKVAERSVGIRIDGMYCDHCPSKVTMALETFGSRLRVDKPPTVADPLLQITYTPISPEFTIRHIFSTISALHPSFTPSVYHPPSMEERSRRIHHLEQRRLFIRLICCIVIAIPTLLIGVVWMSLVPKTDRIRKYLNEPLWVGKATKMEWALFFLATPVQFFIADVFHKRAWKDIRGLWRKGSTVPILRRFYRFGSMNLLISLGVSIAYFASVALLGLAATTDPHVHGHSTSYFDSTVFLTMFLLLGRCLESYSKLKTADAVSMLGNLRPSEALLVVETKPSSPENERSSLEGLDEKDIPPTPQSSSVKKIPVDMLEAGDVIVVQHGGSPPSDGKIISGKSKFDESSLTGEARLVQKNDGDMVYAGTLNRGRSVQVVIDAVSGESMLDQIVKVVREGQTRRAPIERIADVITGYFVPVVTAIAIITWIVWLSLGISGVLPSRWLDTYQGGWPVWSLGFAIACFVVACPCGIGLAAPTALFVGSGLAAKHGILAKGGGEAFQEASWLDCVVFDKTGTLTQGGEPSVMDEEVFVTGDEEVKFVYAVASTLEDNSSHPLARAIVGHCAKQERVGVMGVDVDEIPGRGMRGIFKLKDSTGEESYEAIIGNESYMTENGITALAESTLATLHTWKSSGKSIVLLALKKMSDFEDNTPFTSNNFTLAAAFSAMDPLRPEAGYVVRKLQSSGISVWMISGDNPTTALAVASMVGIPSQNVIAGVLPTEKADKIQYLQKSAPKRPRSRWARILPSSASPKSHSASSQQPTRAIVAMVGDGINDAPALTMADVGVAIGSGSDIAISSAKFILVSSNLQSLLTLTDLSRTVFRRVKFNFFWACVYNLIALPVAAGVLYPIPPVVNNGQRIRLDPVWASLAMALSSVSVVCSSLLLKTKWPVVGFRPRVFMEEGRREMGESGKGKEVKLPV